MPQESVGLTLATVRTILEDLDVGPLGPVPWNFKFHVRALNYDVGIVPGARQAQLFLMHATFSRIDTDTGEFGTGRGRDMVLHPGVTESGIIKTAYVCVRDIVTHELMHAFRFKGKALFDPHAPVALLHEISERAEGDTYNHWKTS